MLERLSGFSLQHKDKDKDDHKDRERICSPSGRRSVATGDTFVPEARVTTTAHICTHLQAEKHCDSALLDFKMLYFSQNDKQVKSLDIFGGEKSTKRGIY